MIFTFKRGIHPNEEKLFTEHIPVKAVLPAAKSELVFPLQQHLGAPCEPIVEIGQKVMLGEKIGDSNAFISSPVHTSVSGTVKDIRPHMTIAGTVAKSIIIENDGQFAEHESIQLRAGFEHLSKEEILRIVREAGIVGLGGAGFPTHAKLSTPPDKKIDTIIVNGAECEPYLTTDNRVMIEEADRLVTGLRIMQKVIAGAKGVIAIENNKPEAIAAVRKAVENQSGIEVAVMQTKYPQGSEKQMIYAVTKREVPSGGLPLDVGCIVNNVDTVVAIRRAVLMGRPLMRKIVTITGGAIKNPGNYKVRLGTKLSDLVELVGGFKSNTAKVVAGGPMMGVAVYDIDVPLVKTTGGVIFFNEKEAQIPPEGNCIRCGACVEHCPSGLIPTELNADIIKESGALFVKHNGLDCIECGSCSYICPAKRRLAQAIRTFRRVQLAKRRQ